MDLGLTESQKMLRASARDFLRQECPSSLVRDMEEDPQGYTSGLWSKMAALGWLGLVIPERLGGVGADFTDLVVLAVPSMSTMGPQDPGLSSYELVQGDYLVLVHPLDQQIVGSAGWHLAKGSANCH